MDASIYLLTVLELTCTILTKAYYYLILVTWQYTISPICNPTHLTGKLFSTKYWFGCWYFSIPITEA